MLLCRCWEENTELRDPLSLGSRSHASAGRQLAGAAGMRSGASKGTMPLHRTRKGSAVNGMQPGELVAWLCTRWLGHASIK
jgi:hypothetical protein